MTRKDDMDLPASGGERQDEQQGERQNSRQGEGQDDFCPDCRHKHTPRDAESLKALKNRLNRMIGQLGGVSRMLDENRYCGDILTQVAAIESALQNFGYLLLKEHLETCVTEQIKDGHSEVMSETMELIRKLK